jgi:hypothetical protein
MVFRPVKAALYDFLTADRGPPLETDRRPRSAVGGQICKGRLNHAGFRNPQGLMLRYGRIHRRYAEPQ